MVATVLLMLLHFQKQFGIQNNEKAHKERQLIEGSTNPVKKKEVEALVCLGYKEADAEEALRKFPNNAAAAAHYLYEVSQSTEKYIK